MHRQPQRQPTQRRRPADGPARRHPRVAQATSAALLAVPMALAGLVAATPSPAAAAVASGPDPILLVGSFPNTGGAAGVVQGFTTSAGTPVGPTGGVGVGGQPWTMAVTPNGGTAFVGNFQSGTVTPVNVSSTGLSTGTSLCLPMGFCPADTGTEPEAVAVTPDGTAAYVANSAESTVSEILLTGSSAPKVANSALALPMNSNPDAIAITPDGSTAWVANYGTSTVVPIELDNGDTVGSPITLPTHSDPTGLAVTPDGRHLLVADSGNGQVTDINLATGAQHSFALEPTAAAGAAPEPWAVAVAPSGTTAWVTDAAGNLLVPVTIATDTPGSPVHVGDHPVAVAIADTAAGPTAYVADQFASEVSIVDVGSATPTQTGTIATAPGPDTLSVTPDQAPVAAFTDTPGTSGALTSFDASASHTTPAGGALTYRWSFGDGSAPVESTMPITTHTYAAPGVYQVTLTVTDALGTSTTVSYTGQTVSNDGGPTATATETVAIAGPLSNATPQALVAGGAAGDAVAYALDSGAPSATQGSTVPFGAGSDPVAVAMAPGGQTGYVLQGAGRLEAVDMRTGTASPPPVAVGTGSDALAVSPSGGDAYVVNGSTSTVTDVTLASGSTSSIPVTTATGADLNAIAVDPAGTTAYVTDGTHNTVTPIDLHTGVAGSPVGSAGTATFTSPDAIAVSPAGGTALVVDGGTVSAPGGVTAVDISGATPVPTGSVAIGGAGDHPDAIAVAPSGAAAYVVDSPSGGQPATLTPLSLAPGGLSAGTPVPAGTITTGGIPYTVTGLTGVAVTPDGDAAYAVGTATDALGATVDVLVPFALSGAGPVAGTPVVMPAGTGPTAIAITPDQAPIARLQVPSTPVAAGSTVSLGALASSNPSSPIATYTWDYGDGSPGVTTGHTGTPAPASAASTTHAYAVAGTYTASVTLTDTAGTSTAPVYTGQSMVRAGGPRATQQQTIVVYPTVSKVSDAVTSSGVGASGDTVTVTGTGFSTVAKGTVLDFGPGVPATAVACPTTTTCTATVPAGTGTVAVTATVGGQTSPVTSPPPPATSADSFTYLPTVTAVAPSSGPVTGGTAVVVTGTGFSTGAGATAFDFGTGNKATAVTCTTATSCTATSPAGHGTVDVLATVTASGRSLTSRVDSPADQFTYGTPGGGGGGGPVAPGSATPVVTSISPATGPASGGTAVTVTGDNLLQAVGATTIDFGPGNPGTAVDCTTAASCTVVSPAGTGTVDVTVSTSTGTSSLTPADRFTYSATAPGGSGTGSAPTVTAVSPASGVPGSVVIVSGSGFTGVQGVSFGTVASPSFSALSSTRLQATVPSGVGGTVDVTVTTAAGTSATSPADRFAVVAIRAAGGSAGYRMVASDGGVFDFGSAPYLGSLPGSGVAVSDIVASASTAGGYWAAGADGGVFAFGDAGFFGSMGGEHLNQPVVGMAATPDGGGYWLVARDGGVFAFGDARFFGSMGGEPLNQPVVGIAPTASGAGYWLAAGDGGVFSFGDATFLGSTGGLVLARPIVTIAATGG